MHWSGFSENLAIKLIRVFQIHRIGGIVGKAMLARNRMAQGDGHFTAFGKCEMHLYFKVLIREINSFCKCDKREGRLIIECVHDKSLFRAYFRIGTFNKKRGNGPSRVNKRWE